VPWGLAMDSGGAPLYETLEASFPQGILSQGLEVSVKARIRQRLRDIGYRVQFLPGEPWEHVVEAFAIASLERIQRGYSANPWFWVVAWPAVIGAAATDFFPEVATAGERRVVANNAAAAHIEAMLLSHALRDTDAVGALPGAAVRGLHAIGQSSLPALPSVMAEEWKVKGRNDILSSLATGAANPVATWQPPALPRSKRPATTCQSPPLPRSEAAQVPVGLRAEAPRPPESEGPWDRWRPASPSRAPKPRIVPARFTAESGGARPTPPLLSRGSSPAAGAAVIAPSSGAQPVVPPLAEAPAARIASTKKEDQWVPTNHWVAGEPCRFCGQPMAILEVSPEEYCDSCVICDECHDPCGLDGPGGPHGQFSHCARCKFDLCSGCSAVPFGVETERNQPQAALKGLHATGASSLPALPSVMVEEAESGGPWDRWKPASPSGAPKPRIVPARVTAEAGVARPTSPLLSRGSSPAAGAAVGAPPCGAQAVVTPLAEAPAAAIASTKKEDQWVPTNTSTAGEPCRFCGQQMAILEVAPEGYGDSCVICDECHNPCGLDGSGGSHVPFSHCAHCEFDLCIGCSAVPLGPVTEGN